MSSQGGPDLVRISCLREVISAGDRTFPLFVGFASASDLVRVASAPSYRATDPQRVIASRVLEPPVSDWQRPLDEDRVVDISKIFDDPENLMPNPVLLSANVDVDPIVPVSIAGQGGAPTGVYEVRIPVPETGQQFPIWILDGQHRINGLAHSGQFANRIPVVLLLSAGMSNSYDGRDFASIFAQVTVTAKALAPIHQEWLTYSYQLGHYAEDADDCELHTEAFKTAAILCSEPSLPDDGPKNPWFNAITFNPEDGAPGVRRSGFNNDCTELKALLLKHYYRPASALGTTLDAEEVAPELAAALTALEHVVSDPQSESVFFGKLPYGHKVMQDAFLAGVCARLVASAPPESWKDLLTALKFVDTNWNFTWASTRGGNAGNVSRRLAEAVMSRAFREQAVPSAAGNLADYLRGNRAEVVVVCSGLKPNGGPSKVGRTEISLLRGDDLSQNIGSLRHIKVLQPGRKGPTKSTSDNIGKITVYYGDRTGPPVQVSGITGAGLNLDTWGPSPLKLAISLEHYGDIGTEANLEISWT